MRVAPTRCASKLTKKYWQEFPVDLNFPSKYSLLSVPLWTVYGPTCTLSSILWIIHAMHVRVLFHISLFITAITRRDYIHWMYPGAVREIDVILLNCKKQNSCIQWANSSGQLPVNVCGLMPVPVVSSAHQPLTYLFGLLAFSLAASFFSCLFLFFQSSPEMKGWPKIRWPQALSSRPEGPQTSSQWPNSEPFYETYGDRCLLVDSIFA